jgi:hypothetical protein
MIHPFARFSAAPAPGETLWERAALLEKPAAEFAAFLKANQHATATPATPHADLAPQQAASSAARSRAGSSPLAESHEAQEPPGLPQPPSPSVEELPGETIRSSAGNSESNAKTANSTTGPPRFADVPESAKHPAGPYRQAPAELGGEWWLVSPFTGEEPWLNQEMAAVTGTSPSRYALENLPEDFLQAFGEMPLRRGGESAVEFIGRVSRWKQDLEFFQRIGIPDGVDETQVELASAAYEQWGMGRPVFYEGRYGWFARFPDSAIPEFEMDAASAVETSHLAIARFQVRLLGKGVEVPQAHPFVPPHLLPQEA